MRNFFERQDEARRKTTRLVVLFVCAVLGIIAGTYAALVLVLGWSGGPVDPVQPVLALAVTVGVLALVGGGSLMKVLSLREGGHVVAEALGGQKLDRESDSPSERQLLNVVEEMAIAAGVPVPPVYVLEEEGINAFAAGHTPDDAVIGVTRGSIEVLDRDEMQGVIAHEFSHILNQDMRLNLRLIGVLHGILLVSITGRLLMHSLYYGGRSRDGRGRMVVVVLGLTLVVVGFVGFFCGRLIKAAVSRQREFLADASAVQFTRNPEGIGGALKKIGGFVEGSQVTAAKAEEASHLFFGYALGTGLFSFGWLSTHPPLEDRIRRIDPSFDGNFPVVSRGAGGERSAPEPSKETVEERSAAVSGLHEGATGAETGASTTRDPKSVVEQAGTLDPEQIAHGARLRAEVPTSLLRTAHEPLGAVAVVYGLLLNEDASMRTRQVRMLRHREPQAVAEEVERLYPAVADLPPRLRLSLLDLAAPALRELSDTQRERLHETVRALVEADDQLTLFEYALSTIVRHRLEHAARPTDTGSTVRRLAPVKEPLRILLSGLASAGHRSVAEARRAYRAGVEVLRANHDVSGIEDPVSVSGTALDGALDRLAAAAPALKKDIIEACARCALMDDEVTEAEFMLLRAVTIALDVPLPPRLRTRES